MSERKQKVSTEEKIIASYIEYMLGNGSRPTSVFKFMKDIKMKESTFYDHFNSFDSLENTLWEGFFSETIEALHADDNYAAFTCREKLLSFFYTFIEILKNNRSFVVMRLRDEKRPGRIPVFMKKFRVAYMDFIEALLIEGRESGEIANRKYIDRIYSEAFWIQLLFLMKFWAGDDSRRFEKTDEAIERVVNLSFELIGEGPLDQIFDFVKFLYQNR